MSATGKTHQWRVREASMLVSLVDSCCAPFKHLHIVRILRDTALIAEQHHSTNALVEYYDPHRAG